jgi:hypothetical protein
MPVSWQLLQLPEMPLWIFTDVGAGLKNKVPGPVALVALAAIKPAGVLVWQFSQVVPDGM